MTQLMLPRPLGVEEQSLRSMTEQSKNGDFSRAAQVTDRLLRRGPP